MYVVRECSNFILLQVAVQFSAPLIEEAVFSPLYILASFIKDKVTICVWVYFWAFYPVPVIHSSVFVPVPYCLDYCIPTIYLNFYKNNYLLAWTDYINSLSLIFFNYGNNSYLTSCLDDQI